MGRSAVERGIGVVLVRTALANDVSFMQRMLYEATNRPGEQWRLRS